MLGIILIHSSNSVGQGRSVEPRVCLLIPLARLASLFGEHSVSRGKSYRQDATHTFTWVLGDPNSVVSSLCSKVTTKPPQDTILETSEDNC